MQAPVYLDYAATTPLAPEVLSAMQPYLNAETLNYGNAHSNHFYGKKSRQAVEMARQQIADQLGAMPEEIIFTSGATEANNLAIKGIAQAKAHMGKHIITTAIEHSSILNACEYLKQQGYEISCVKPNAEGLIDPATIKALITQETILITLAHANAELGVIQDITAIAALCEKHHITFHVDAAQSLTKLPLQLTKLPIDLISISAHKFYGPKGIGVLYVRRKRGLQLTAQIHGGLQEFGLRSGTLPTHQIVGLSKALEISMANMQKEDERIKALRDYLYEQLKPYDNIILNGHWQKRLANNLNISITNLETHFLHSKLASTIAYSTHSACSSHELAPSHVLTAIGRNKHTAQNAIRLTLGLYTTPEDIEVAATAIKSLAAQTSL